MIPKIIHYCWFGKNEMPALAHKCIDSWKRFFPDWEIMLWNESNSPMQNQYMQTAFTNKKWSNLSNYTRLHALNTIGGIYFDTDVEVIKVFDFLDKYDCFAGFESEPNNPALSVNNAILGSSRGHSFIKECLKEIEQNYDGTEMANLSSPYLTTNVLIKHGLSIYGDQNVGNVHVFDMKSFYPYTWNDIFTYSCVTPATYTIHYWDMSWKDKEIEVKELLYKIKSLDEHVSYLSNKLSAISSGKIGAMELAKLNLKFIRSIFK